MKVMKRFLGCLEEKKLTKNDWKKLKKNAESITKEEKVKEAKKDIKSIQ